MIGSATESLRVALLAGGESPERDVSLASGRNVAGALVALGHRVTCLDPVWSRPPAPESVCPRFAPAAVHSTDWQRFDACFLALHGGAGEDGRLQQLLTDHGAAFTGPNPAAARLAMSKRASKACFQTARVPTPEFAVFRRGDASSTIAAAARALGYPLVVKPDAQGSSLGVSLARGPQYLSDCVRQCLQVDDVGLLERYVAGREFTVAVLDGAALPTLEIVGPEPIFSFDEKYASPGPHGRFELSLTADEQRALTSAALAAAHALGAAEFARVDLRWDDAGQPWVLELNAIPGLTAASLAPAAALRAGLDLPRLCAQLLAQAIERPPGSRKWNSPAFWSKDRAHECQEECRAG